MSPRQPWRCAAHMSPQDRTYTFSICLSLLPRSGHLLQAAAALGAEGLGPAQGCPFCGAVFAQKLPVWLAGTEGTTT